MRFHKLLCLALCLLMTISALSGLSLKASAAITLPVISLDEIGVLIKGNSHPVIGTVTSSTNVTKVTGQFFYANGTKAGDLVTITPNTKTVTLRSTKINSNLKFGTLGKGDYELRITATNAAGTVTKSVKFTIDMVKIGHANGDKDGKAGDSSGKEVLTAEWYVSSSNGPWKYVIRAKDPAVAEKIATAMEQACANDNIGYSKTTRTTCYTQAKKVNWNLSKITTKCDADCSSLVAVCVNAAGITVSSFNTDSLFKTLKGTGKFEWFTTENYTGHVMNLKRGDIVVRPKSQSTDGKSGHTFVVLTNGCKAGTTSVETPSSEFYPPCAASCTTIKSGLSNIGVDNSLEFRKLIAAANVATESIFVGYSGTAAQNTRMLEMLKQGILRKP